MGKRELLSLGYHKQPFFDIVKVGDIVEARDRNNGRHYRAEVESKDEAARTATVRWCEPDEGEDEVVVVNAEEVRPDDALAAQVLPPGVKRSRKARISQYTGDSDDDSVQHSSPTHTANTSPPVQETPATPTTPAVTVTSTTAAVPDAPALPRETRTEEKTAQAILQVVDRGGAPYYRVLWPRGTVTWEPRSHLDDESGVCAALFAFENEPYRIVTTRHHGKELLVEFSGNARTLDYVWVPEAAIPRPVIERIRCPLISARDKTRAAEALYHTLQRALKNKFYKYTAVTPMQTHELGNLLAGLGEATTRVRHLGDQQWKKYTRAELDAVFNPFRSGWDELVNVNNARIGKVDWEKGVEIRTVVGQTRPRDRGPPQQDGDAVQELPKLWTEMVAVKIVCEESSEEQDKAIADRLADLLGVSLD